MYEWCKNVQAIWNLTYSSQSECKIIPSFFFVPLFLGKKGQGLGITCCVFVSLMHWCSQNHLILAFVCYGLKRTNESNNLLYICTFQLDAGSPEKISLMSRDEQNILVVSYAELKQCFENAFGDVLNVAHASGIS